MNQKTCSVCKQTINPCKESLQLTPFCCPECKTFHFPIKGVSDIVYLYPIKQDMYEDSMIAIPEEWKDENKSARAVVLATGPGYYNRKGKYIPIDPRFTCGLNVIYDKTVPWSIEVKDKLGKKHEVVLCNARDVYGYE